MHCSLPERVFAPRSITACWMDAQGTTEYAGVTCRDDAIYTTARSRLMTCGFAILLRSVFNMLHACVIHALQRYALGTNTSQATTCCALCTLLACHPRHDLQFSAVCVTYYLGRRCGCGALVATSDRIHSKFAACGSILTQCIHSL